MNIQNIGGVHNNGMPNLQIGLEKNHGFNISYNSDIDMIMFTDANSGKVLPVLAPSSSSPFNFCGQYKTYNALQNDITSGIINPSNGDTYHILFAGGNDANGNPIKVNTLIAYANGKWFIIPN